MRSARGKVIPVAAVDFDGTICDFAYPGEGKPKAGVRAALKKLQGLGYWILIYSCRASDWLVDVYQPDEKALPRLQRKPVRRMRAYLKKYNIPYDEIDDGSAGKPTADFIIDDKAIRFEDNWPAIVKFIEKET